MSAPIAMRERHELRTMLLARYAEDPEVAAALEELHRDHATELPDQLRELEQDTLHDAIRRHDGSHDGQPSTRPRFATLDIHDIDELTWRDPLTGRLDHPQSADWAAAYLAAVRALAERFGLHRLDPRNEQRPFSAGETIIHNWMQARAQFGPSVDARWLVMMVADAYFLPPSAKRTITVDFDPATDDPEEPVIRVRALVREARAARDQAWRKAGLMRRRSPERARHLEWLYLKVRHGWSYKRIADQVAAEEHVAEPRAMVQRALIRIANDAGVDRSGW